MGLEEFLRAKLDPDRVLFDESEVGVLIREAWQAGRREASRIKPKTITVPFEVWRAVLRELRSLRSRAGELDTGGMES